MHPVGFEKEVIPDVYHLIMHIW